MLKRILTYLSLLLIILGASWALFKPEFFRVHDYVHAARVVEMSRALQDGHIIPRWSQNFGFGYGMPLFEFYAPLPYFVGSLLFLLGIPMIVVLKMLFVICNIFTAIGSYKLGKQLDGRVGGIVAATLLTLAPYRAVNLYVRGALSEAWGIMAIPWIFYGIILVFKKVNYGWWIITLATTVLLLSHNLTSIITLPSILFVVLFGILSLIVYTFQTKNSRKLVLHHVFQQSLIVVASLLLAVGLSSFYTLPAVAEKQFTKVEQAVTTGYFEYGLHFLYLRQFLMDDWGYGGSSWGPEDDISFYFGTTQIICLIFAAITFTIISLNKIKSKKNSIKQTHILLIGLIASVALVFNIFMTTPKSAFVWESISSLEFIQFPWRWLSAAIVWIAILGSVSFSLITKTKARIVLAGMVIVVSVLLNGRYFQPEKYLPDFNSMYYTDAETISKSMSNILYDYMPEKVPITIIPPQQFVSCFIENVNFEQGCQTSTILLDRVQEKLFTIKTTEETKVTIALADFPGWEVEVNGKPIEHTANDNGLIQFMVPKGEPTVGVYFGSTPVRTFADTLTFISFAILVYALIPYITQKRNNA